MRLRRVKAHPYAPSYGAQISDEETPQRATGLPFADDETLGWARCYWPEADADDFDWDSGRGRKVIHRATGEVWKIRLGHPVGGELASDVQTFVVRDGRLILLARPGSERPTIVLHGTWDGRKIEYGGVPREGRSGDPRRPHRRLVPLTARA